MGERSKRIVQPIDYNIFHKTGEKVKKVDTVHKVKTLGMDDPIKLKRNISILSNKIDEFVKFNDLEYFDELDEVKKFIAEANLLKSELIECHTDLRLAVTDQEYEMYDKMYNQELEELRKCIKGGNTLRKSIKREEKEEKERKEKEEKVEKERKEKEEKVEKERKEKEEKVEKERKEKEEKVEKERKEKEEKEEKERKEKEEKEEKERKEKEEKEEKLRQEWELREDEVRREREQRDIREIDMREESEEKERHMSVTSIEKAINESTEFRRDNKHENLRKVDDFKQCLYEARSVKVRLMNTDVETKSVLKGSKYESANEELQIELDNLQKYIIKGQNIKDDLELELDAFESWKINERSRKEDEERIKKERKEDLEREGRNAKEAKEIEVKITESTYRIQEIEFLLSDLEGSIDFGILSKLDDVKLLGNMKRVYETGSKYNDLRGKLDKLSEFIPFDYPDRVKIIPKLWQDVRDLGIRQSSFVKSFDDEILKRGINSGNANSARIDIRLEKFTGYDSAIDIFSFQTQFEELVYGKVENRLLPCLLKNNYLGGTALALVKNVGPLDEIWIILKGAFGNPEELLQNKLKQVEDLGPIWKLKHPEKLVDFLSKLVNAMKDLSKMAEKHSIENNLYYGGGVNTILRLAGNSYQRKFFSQKKDTSNKKEIWQNLIEFFSTNLELEKMMALESKVIDNVKQNKLGRKDESKSYNSEIVSDKLKCHICGGDDHVKTKDYKGKQVVQYFACKLFVEMKPIERFKALQEKGLCWQCLNPGELSNSGWHKEGKCFNRYSCKHSEHSKYPIKKHVFVCSHYEKDVNSKKLFELFVKEKISIHKGLPRILGYLANIASVSEVPLYVAPPLREERKVHKNKIVPTVLKPSEFETEGSIYMLQTIKLGDLKVNLFFDTGCSELVTKRMTIEKLQRQNRAFKERDGPIMLGGVGNQKTICKHGIYKVVLPLHNGNEAVLSGPCIEQVTADFPMYPLNGRVQRDIFDAYRSTGGSVQDLPRLPEEVGGETDIMIGIKYLKYFPEAKFKLPSGLTLYESPFVSPDGTRGVVGGPHNVFAEIEKYCVSAQIQVNTYLIKQIELIEKGYQVNPDIHLLGYKSNVLQDQFLEEYNRENDLCDVNTTVHPIRQLKSSKLIEQIEKAGTEVSYRCVDCRDCNECKNGGQIEYISIQEEFEQNVINKSVYVDVENGITVAKLPFIVNPENKLNPNKGKALKVYNSQVKKLNKSQKDKEDVIGSEQKLQSMGFVDFLDNLSEEQKTKIFESKVQYYIPWRAVWNTNSISTPCRLVFDASLMTSSGYSLNSILAKGRNNMNKLVEIMIRWLSHRFAYHTDIQKMYNTIKLAEEDWCYQLYLWDSELNSDKTPSVKVIKTLIYGVRSSGNQAERGLRETAKKVQNEFPRVNEVVQSDIYVDDCMSGEGSWDKVLQTTDNLQIALNRGGFAVKGFTFSGKDPPENLSSDGVSISVGGMKWFPKQDCIRLDTSHLNFDHKTRGKKSSEKNYIIPKDFTRRDCVGKVAEVFDLLGKATPIMSGLKYDLRTLTLRKLDWDDKIPSDLKSLWTSNFEMIKDLSNIKFKRAIVPSDALSLEIDTIDTGDATPTLVCSAIYARFKRKNGEYSCQLVFSRSKLVPEGTTLPRAELLAACLNANTGHVVKLSFGSWHKSCIKLTDSQVVLYWINNTEGPLKQWVRNRVIEINRLADKTLWRYVRSKDMLADLGTKKGAKLHDIDVDSAWINGYSWMRLDSTKFPVKTVEEVKLDSKDLKSAYDEAVYKESMDDLLRFDWPNATCNEKNTETISSFICRKELPEDMCKRLSFSKYILDPNKFRFRKVIRIVALVMLFVNKLQKRVKDSKGINVQDVGKTCVCMGILQNFPEVKATEYLVTSGESNGKVECQGGLVVVLTDSNIGQALDYYFRKATLEIKEFVDKKLYENISKEHSGILHYTGRILPTQKVIGRNEMSDVMIDLSNSTFHVPLVDQKSPLAYSIINEVHWYDRVARHSGVETVLRYTMKYAFIIGGRDLTKLFRRACIRCRILAKRTIDISMGPISDYNLTIAPAFYISQVDIFGPFLSYSNHNKRATVKIWFLTFCCCTTGAVRVKLMENYSTTSFMLAFIRFSCDVGYPKMLLPDEGSQLVKGCKEMKLSFYDIQHKLNIEYGVEYNTCPVGAHFMHGKVERKIRSVQNSMSVALQNNRLSIIEWETLGDEIANCANDVPLAVGNVVSDLEYLDILTPNRLMKGRNNDRSPAGPLFVTGKPDKIIQSNLDIFRVWFECWLISHVPKLMDQPKWFNNDQDTKVGDIVLFKKTDKEIVNTYQYGIIKSLNISKDNKKRVATVEYINHNENIKRTTTRGVRDLIMIHPIDELNIFQELGQMATTVDMQKRLADGKTAS